MCMRVFLAGQPQVDMALSILWAMEQLPSRADETLDLQLK